MTAKRRVENRGCAHDGCDAIRFIPARSFQKAQGAFARAKHILCVAIYRAIGMMRCRPSTPPRCDADNECGAPPPAPFSTIGPLPSPPGSGLFLCIRGEFGAGLLIVLSEPDAANFKTLLALSTFDKDILALHQRGDSRPAQRGGMDEDVSLPVGGRDEPKALL